MEPVSAEAAPEAAPNILIVDDSATMRAMIKRVAALAGVPVGTIFEAANGQEALGVLDRHPVQFVFTDINMPVMTGTELLRAMQDREEWRDVVRIVISTDGSDSRRMEAADLNVRMYVEKPFRPEVMRDVLSNLTPAPAGR
ncbi:MAG: response regulator [Vicinamibacterales bacterium]|nr:response regulator [Acidobacteriota bacterium]